MRPRVTAGLLALGLAVFATVSSISASADAEATTLNVAKQYGLGYLQLMLMEDGKLIEKHAAQAGLGDVAVNWATFRSSDVMNDAVISGTVDFVCLGPPGLATIWAKTRGNIDVRGASGLNAMPLFLNTRNPAINSIRDFTDKDRIALPAIKVAVQAIILQMAAAKEWGDAEFAKLDPLTVSMAHPDGMIALLSGKGEIDAHFTSPPFQYKELAAPGIHRVLDSFTVLGGPMSFNVIATTEKFRRANPKLYDAFLAALAEATARINADMPAAAEIYRRMTKDQTPADELVGMMKQPGVAFTLIPEGIAKIAAFMAKAGTIKTAAPSWKDMFFPNVHDQPGS
jgi:NitT/TauT family transport system substrate-binding protein